MKNLLNKIHDFINPKEIRLILPENNSRIKEAKKKLSDIGFQIIELDGKSEDFFNDIKRLKFAKDWSDISLLDYINNPVNHGMAMLKNNLADILIAGSSTSTADVIRSGLRFIGLKNNSSCLSSMFLMVAPDESRIFSYSDCAVIPEPNEAQLADLAYDTCINHNFLTGEDPKVAFLSFSTNSSATHYRVSKVQRAIEIFIKKYPDIICEPSEVQFDSAICNDVAIKKYPDSILKGAANVLIYPNLDAGNIAYKITERIGGYTAVGPLLQGFDKPIHDLSRGCTVSDIFEICLIASYREAVNANI